MGNFYIWIWQKKKANWKLCCFTFLFCFICGLSHTESWSGFIYTTKDGCIFLRLFIHQRFKENLSFVYILNEHKNGSYLCDIKLFSKCFPMTTTERKNINKHKKCIKCRPLNMKWALETVHKKKTSFLSIQFSRCLSYFKCKTKNHQTISRKMSYFHILWNLLLLHSNFGALLRVECILSLNDRNR